jgi:hypothetical protein
LASLYGRVALLGQESIHAPRFNDKQALRVHPTALAWLMAGRDGVVVVNPRKAAPLLRDAEPLEVASAAFGQRLRNLLTLAPPRIYAPAAEIRAAI